MVEDALATERELQSLLRERFGHEEFRSRQWEVIGNVLSGRDCLVLMPTGGGKSLCYQLPALALPGVTLVVSPLIALMKDQVDALNAKGIPAEFINSSLTPWEVESAQERVLQGLVKLLYAAPERVATPGFARFLRNARLSLIAIDEAHCISEWGHEFRPDYRELAHLRREFPETPIIALTATATPRVRQDILEHLGMRQGGVFVESFNRQNLRYSVRQKQGWRREVVERLRALREQAAIVYCFSRKDTEDVAGWLRGEGFHAAPYHAGLDAETRRRTQESFLRGETPVVVATIAFGMGVDKPNIRLVAHHSMPKSLEGYYQETGRAGRDGLPSECVLFYSAGDRSKQEQFIREMRNAQEQRNAREMLGRVAAYAQQTGCRRRTLIEYFGEEWPHENCGACDACLDPREEFDATEIAQKVLSAVARTGERYGPAYVMRVLVGGRDRRIVANGHDKLSVYGIVRDFTRPQVREILAQLVARDLLVENDEEYATLSLTLKGWAFLKERQEIRLMRPAADDRPPQRGPRGAVQVEASPYAQGLFEELRTLRKQTADAEGVAAFMVFPDSALREMAAAAPRTPEEFARVRGVGAMKAERYGAPFLDAVRDYAARNGAPPPASAGRLSSAAEGGARPAPRKQGVYAATGELLSSGLSIAEIARERGLAESTIISHMERLSERGERLELERVLPAPDALREMERAFSVCGGGALRPVYEFLNESAPYNALRIARLHLRQEGRLPEA